MDPDEALKQLLVMAKKATNNELEPHEVERFGELFLALNQWLESGAFLPFDWRQR